MKTRSEVEAWLINVSFARLFGDGAWLADRESCSMLDKQLSALGLQERSSDNTWRLTD